LQVQKITGEVASVVADAGSGPKKRACAQYDSH